MFVNRQLCNHSELPTTHGKVQVQSVQMTDLGELAWILGIHVKHDWTLRTITLLQATYIDSIVKWFNLMSASPL